MSLIIAALKKKRESSSLTQVSEELPVKVIAKESLRTGPGRLWQKRILILGSTSMVLLAGAGWYIASAGSNTLLRSNVYTPLAEIAVTAPVVSPVTAPVTAPVTEAVVNPESAVKCAQTTMPVPVVEPAQTRLIRVETPILAVDALLTDAYLAWRKGGLDEAERLYQAMHEKEADNLDAMLGLAAIAQKRGDNLLAAQFYARVLALDPRNPAANAGMSALNPDEYSESRLKMLLRVQGNSAPLYFALGNLYAGLQRWGEAQQAYYSAYMLAPDNTEYAYNLAVSQDHTGQKKLAAQYYYRALQLDVALAAGFDHAQISQHAQELAQ